MHRIIITIISIIIINIIVLIFVRASGRAFSMAGSSSW